MLSFAKIEGDKGKYPKQTYEGQENQAYGFLDARKIQTGIVRGTLTIVNTDGSKVLLGVIPNSNGEFGIAFLDPDGTTIFKQTGSTLFMYDAETKLNNLQLGKLPDGTTSLAIAKDNIDVTTAF